MATTRADPAQRAAQRDDLAAFEQAFGGGDAAACAVLAAKHGSATVLAWLLARPQPLPLGRLFDAAITDFRTVPRRPGHARALESIIAAGLDPRERIGWLAEPAILAAARYGVDAAAAALRARVGDPDVFVEAALGEAGALRARLARDSAAARALDANGFSALCYAAASSLPGREGVRAGVEALLAHGADPSHSVAREVELSPLILACWWGGDEAVVDALIAAGADLGRHGLMALRWALEPHQRSGGIHGRLAERLLAAGVRIDLPDPSDPRQRTLLRKWSEIGQAEAVRWLLEHGADARETGPDGRTPLHHAAQRNTFTTVAELLLAHGAEIDARDHEGRTALDVARAHKRQRLVDFLAQRGGRD